MPMRQKRRAKIIYLFAEYTKLVMTSETYSVTSVKWSECQQKAAAVLETLRAEINHAMTQEEDITYRIGQQRVDLMLGSLDQAVDKIARFRLAVRINSALPPVYNLPDLPPHVILPQDEEGQ